MRALNHRKDQGFRRLRGPAAAAFSLVLLASCTSDMTVASGDAAPGVCTAGATRCQDNNVEVCQNNGWQQQSTCVFGSQTCKVVNGQALCVDDPTCQDGVKNQDETDVDCGGASCYGCEAGKACTSDTDCKSGACSGGVCKTCKAGTASCFGRQVRICKADESGWDVIATCDATKGEVCNAASKQCEPSQVIGSAKPTGKYYLYAMFKVGSSDFKGGYDVDSYVDVVGDTETNYIYVNRKTQLDVYKVELEDTDKDGKLEPNQHPDNPDDTGPMEQRKLTFIKTYTNVKLGQPSVGEIYALKDKIYFLRNDSGSYNLYEFIFKTGVTNLVHKGDPKLPMCVLGYDQNNDRWIGGWNSSVRRVWSFYPGQGWATEFDYPNLAGSHMDGLEVVIDPKTKISYVYVSDMTSDFLAQYYQDPKTGQWIQKNVFEYDDPSSQLVEGMGFGAFQHFWATSGTALYEVGGGDLQKYVGPQID